MASTSIALQDHASQVDEIQESDVEDAEPVKAPARRRTKAKEKVDKAETRKPPPPSQNKRRLRK